MSNVQHLVHSDKGITIQITDEKRADNALIIQELAALGHASCIGAIQLRSILDGKVEEAAGFRLEVVAPATEVVDNSALEALLTETSGEAPSGETTQKAETSEPKKSSKKAPKKDTVKDVAGKIAKGGLTPSKDGAAPRKPRKDGSALKEKVLKGPHKDALNAMIAAGYVLVDVKSTEKRFYMVSNQYEPKRSSPRVNLSARADGGFGASISVANRSLGIKVLADKEKGIQGVLDWLASDEVASSVSEALKVASEPSPKAASGETTEPSPEATSGETLKAQSEV